MERYRYCGGTTIKDKFADGWAHDCVSFAYRLNEQHEEIGQLSVDISLRDREIACLRKENKDLREKVEKIVNISDSNRTKHKYESTGLRQAIIKAKQLLEELSSE